MRQGAPVPLTDVERALDAADDGRPDALERIASPGPGRPERDAWTLALRCARWFHLDGPMPAREDLRALAGASQAAREGATRAAVLLLRGAVVALDGDALADLTPLVRAVAPPGSVAQLWAQAGEGWAALLAGHHARVETAARALLAEAQAARAVALVVETTALRAMAALGQADVVGATALARRAALMARTEGLLPPEILTSVVLARVRRYDGKPQLALRILSAISQVAPVVWRGWLGWELLFAGGRTALSAAFATSTTAPADAPRALARATAAQAAALDAAQAGDRGAFDDAVAAVALAVGGAVDLAREAALLHAALDVTARAPEALAPWCRGTTAAPHAGLQGVSSPEGPRRDDADDPITSFVVAGAGPPARRVLRPGLGLVDGGREAEREDAARTAGGRIETALAVLLLAGAAGLTVADFFQAVYGFGYRPNAHRDVLKVVLHRVRARLGDAGDLRRDGEQLGVALARPVVVADPRCRHPAGDRLVRRLATAGGATAAELAEALHMPLRTVQRELRRLAEDGSCRVDRQGRTVAYRVEDTTFSEPTSLRMLATGRRREEG